MTIALSVLALLAIVAAIGAGSRVQRQLAQPQSSPSSVQEPSLSETPKLQLEPDRDLDQPVSPSASPPSSDRGFDFERLQADTSLAGSLSVSEVMHPTEVEPSIFLRAEPDEPIAGMAASNPAKRSHESHNLLEEMAELAPGGHKTQIAHLTHYVNHADSVMRSAAAFALGDLASHCHGEDLEKIVSLLHQFAQDANPQVRLQAATALGTLSAPDLFSE